MCKSATEGGQRCAAHTRERYLNTTPAAGCTFDTAAADYASTPEGATRIAQDAADAANNRDFDAEARLRAALDRGQALRAANKEAATLMAAATSPDAIAAADSDAVDAYRRNEEDAAHEAYAAPLRDQQGGCRTDGCEGNPNDGEGANGYCGNCADRIENDEEEAAHTERGCRTDGCQEDPNDGEGWDGYCGNCADRIEAEGYDEDQDGEPVARFAHEQSADRRAATLNTETPGAYVVRHDIDADEYVIVHPRTDGTTPAPAPEPAQAPAPAPTVSVADQVAALIRRTSTSNTLTTQADARTNAANLSLVDIDTACSAASGTHEIDDTTAHAIIRHYGTAQTPTFQALTATGTGTADEMFDELAHIRDTNDYYAMSPVEKLRLDMLGTWIINHQSRRGA